MIAPDPLTAVVAGLLGALCYTLGHFRGYCQALSDLDEKRLKELEQALLDLAETDPYRACNSDPKG